MGPYTSLAKSAVETYIKEGKVISPPSDLPEEFRKRMAGVFVTIEKFLTDNAKLELRGCIGTYLPTKENIAEEIIYNAILVATEDYRFGPIQKEELPHLIYIVYILSKPELVKNVSELDPRTYGIVVKTLPITEGLKDSPQSKTDVLFNGNIPYKSGLLLPDLEGIDTAKQQIATACQKAGINLEKEKILIYKFTAEKHG